MMASSVSNEQQLLNEIREVFPTFKCTLQDLRNPTEEFVNEFFVFWLQEFGSDVMNITQVQFNQQPIICAHSEAYTATIAKVNILTCLRSFDIVPDFGMLDLVSPHPKRTQTIMRAFIHFFKWSDRRVDCLGDKYKKVNEMKNQCLLMVSKKEELKAKQNSVTLNIGQLLTSKSQIQDEIVSQEQKTDQIKIEQQLVKTKLDEVKKELNEMENTDQKIDRELAMVSNKVKECSNNVVDSPTSIVNELDDLRRRSEHIIELSKQKRDMIELKMQASNKLTQIFENQQKREEDVKEIFKLIDQLRNTKQELLKDGKKVTKLQETLQELQSHLITLSKEKCCQQESLQSLYLRWKTIKPELEKAVEDANKELKNVTNEQKKFMKNLEGGADIQKQLDSLIGKCVTYVSDFTRDYKEFQNLIELNIETVNMKGMKYLEEKKKEIQK